MRPRARSTKPLPASSSGARRVGRPPKGSEGAGALSRDVIIAKAASLALNESLSEITIARLAREFNVTPGLVHYYVGSHDDILTAVINLAYRERMESFPPLTGDWQVDLKAHMACTYRMLTRWRGIAAYLANHNKYRLFQNVPPGEADYGLLQFDRAGRILRSSGMGASDAARAFQILVLFVQGAAASELNYFSPSVHREFFLSRIDNLPPRTSAGARFLGRKIVLQQPGEVFEKGVDALIDSFASYVRKRAPVTSSSRGRRSPAG